MQNKKLIRFVESFILLPALTISGVPIVNTMRPVSQVVIGIAENIIGTPSAVSSQKQNIGASGLLAFNDAIDRKLEDQRLKADAIDAYFRAHDMPLVGTGMKMVLEAQKNNIDWRLLPAIAVRESTGGQFACKKVTYNSFGWASCKVGFSSNEEAIETIALNLGGNHPKTEKYYDNKNTKQILRTYNPPSIVPRYAEQVISIMNDIGTTDTTPATTANT